MLVRHATTLKPKALNSMSITGTKLVASLSLLLTAETSPLLPIAQHFLRPVLNEMEDPAEHPGGSLSGKCRVFPPWGPALQGRPPLRRK
mmetsp:Transcript_70347/g.134024  ORF Transcript_70347/g.134024 Transcript_70347/m.134024 type:complete len:89 (-) Transcript_70347:47-313(-)